MAWRVFEVVQAEWAARLPSLGVVERPLSAVGMLDNHLLKAYRLRRKAEKKKAFKSAVGLRGVPMDVDWAATGRESMSEVERLVGTG